MKRLLKAILVMMTSQVAVASVGIVRNKLLAVLLGPAGVGFFAQLQVLQGFLQYAATMGMQQGALKYMAVDRARNQDQLPTTVSTASKTFAAFSVLLLAICLPLAKPIASWSLGDASLYLFVIPVIAGVPFLIQTELWQTYLRSGFEMKRYSATMVTTAVVGLPLVVPLVFIWKQAGLAAHLLIVAVIGYIIARLYANRSLGPDMRRRIRSAPYDRKLLINLMRFAGGNLPINAVGLAVPFLVRAQIVRDMGLDANGIFQSAFVLSNQYLSMILNATLAYVVPKISQLTENKEINHEVNNALKIGLLLCTFGILSVLLFRDLLISALFSKAFLPAVGLIGWQLIGDHFRGIELVLQTPLVPQERFRARVVIGLIRNVVFLTVFYLPNAEHRLEGAVWAHAIGYTVMCLSTYLYTNRSNGFTISRPNKLLLATSTATVMLLAFVDVTDIRWRIAGVVVMAAWAATSLNRDDLGKIKRAIARRARAQMQTDEDK